MMIPLGDAAFSRLRALSDKRGIVNPDLLTCWAAAVGEDWGRLSFPIRVIRRRRRAADKGRDGGRDGGADRGGDGGRRCETILEISAPAALACEMAHCTTALLERINRFHAADPITGLKYRDSPLFANPSDAAEA